MAEIARKDVKITSCKADAGGGKPTATGTIVNHSSKTSAYTVHVKFKDSSGNSVGDGVSLVASVDPNTSANLTLEETEAMVGELVEVNGAWI